ncbi:MULTISPECIES: MDR family oxidoreductase [Burkholderia]|uniref:MDR family oxidoreductase n=1 Tax=Burkholderia TaxID=32008 RepID=UPI00158ACA2B|nr:MULTISPECIES: MDR family oxidoreductase [Burkholderia]MDN7683127.1 MDR family oxidoreductase [Burkholderia cenocepacia]
MTESFNALLIKDEDRNKEPEVVLLTADDLPAGDVLVRVEYSSLNYKDAMAVTGTGKIVRSYPMVPGIDLAGTVLHSDSPSYVPGQKVVLTGWSVGERYWGGYTQVQRVKSEWLVPLPSGLSTHQAMAIGTAGFTAMLCVQTLEEAGIEPGAGSVLVTGAAGGVGSVAVALLASLGYRVSALVPHPALAEQVEYLRDLGAQEVISGDEWRTAPAPLEKQRWAAAIDTVGSVVLARALAEVSYGGAVAACGLAGGSDLTTTVMPFILRGVRLLGVDSVQCPAERRANVWERIARQIADTRLDQVASTIGLSEVVRYGAELMSGKTRGRTVVDVNR